MGRSAGAANVRPPIGTRLRGVVVGPMQAMLTAYIIRCLVRLAYLAAVEPSDQSLEGHLREGTLKISHYQASLGAPSPSSYSQASKA